MDTQALRLASLAALLHAEQMPAALRPNALAKHYRLSRRFQPQRAEIYASLSQAAALSQTDNRASHQALPTTQSVRQAGPVLLVCESQRFEPDLDSMRDQILLRLLAGARQAGREGWILRTPARRRPLRGLLAHLPARPSVIVSVGLSDPLCLEELSSLAPVVRLGLRSASLPRIPCVEYDAQQEAYAIASYAASHKIDQIAFIGIISKAAGKRSINTVDFAVLSALTTQAQNRHMAVPANLTFWVEANQTLEATNILPRLSRQDSSRILTIVSGPRATSELASAPGYDTSHILCRHWSAEGVSCVPVIGPDLDSLCLALLTRTFSLDKLPSEAAVLMPPVWHQ